MKKTLSAIAIYALPVMAFAQTNARFDFGYFTSAITNIGNIINLLLPITVAAALLFFFYGLAKFVLNAGDEDARSEAKQMMIWGVVALFVMVSVWGLVSFLGSIVGVGQGQSLPNVPRVGGF
jgi:succinate dehydrogenase/fumarate reductase cytochrome b subunit